MLDGIAEGAGTCRNPSDILRALAPADNVDGDLTDDDGLVVEELDEAAMEIAGRAPDIHGSFVFTEFLLEADALALLALLEREVVEGEDEDFFSDGGWLVQPSPAPGTGTLG